MREWGWNTGHRAHRAPDPQAALAFAETHASPVYAYRFNHVPEFLPVAGRFLNCFEDSVCHALELPYVWHMESLVRTR